MTDEELPPDHAVSNSGALQWSAAPRIVAIVAAVYVIASIVFFVSQQRRISELTAEQAKTDQRLEDLASKFQASSDALAAQVGMTQKELAMRAAQLQRSQRAAESRLSAAEQEQAEKTHSDLVGVATEVGSVKSDVASTKSDLEITKAKLERAIGDLGLQSGLIARNHDELELLKHQNDRNYYEFTLKKNEKQPVSTISLQLRKSDSKRNKFTLDVFADDKRIEKKDKNLFEPLQFYTGKDHLLYELVVNDVQKNQISGYLATPKNAPQPISMQ